MEDKTFYLLLFVILFLILMVCLIFLLISNRKLFQRITTLQEINDNLSSLNDRLRMDRHDYLNQLQIVYGLMELKEYDEMNSYLKKVYNELLKTGKTIKTAKPAVNALLAAKLSECESKGIDLIIEVKSNLKNIGIEDWELCKVLSNLLDNAIRALEDCGRPEKRIRININETREIYTIEVENNGPEIPDDVKEHIFKKGFTTKKTEGHGMGLSIVSKILDDCNGRISFDSDKERTVFTVEFEKGG